MPLWRCAAVWWAACTTLTGAWELTRIRKLYKQAPPIHYPSYKQDDYCDAAEWVYRKPSCNAMPSGPQTVKDESEWDMKYKMCGGTIQSPIHISFMQTSFKSFEPIQFSGFDVPLRFTVENGGNAVYITPRDADLESYGGPLTVRYNVSKGIFHFGNGTGRGSEHTIDSKEFAAELQLLVSSERPTSTSCFKTANGLAIFVILFQQQPNPNHLLDPFINSTEHLQTRGNRSEMRIPLSHFLPNTTLHYYLYLGSLTFPPCTSRAIVVVFSNPVGIGDAQLLKLRTNLFVYIDQCKYRVAGNLRQTMSLNNRVIYRSFKFTDISRSAPLAPRVITCLSLFYLMRSL